MTRRARIAAALGCAAWLAACASTEAGRGRDPALPLAALEVEPSARAAVPAPADDAIVGPQTVDAMLARVAVARGLPVLRPVTTRVLDRAGMLAAMRAQVEAEIPTELLRHQGEALVALELIPPGYDLVEGTYALLQASVAGFYDPRSGTMYLARDLGPAAMRETLAHELVHALQDQRYALATLLKWVPGDSDRLAAAHALGEGDATSAMLDVTMGSASRVSPSAMRRLLAASTAQSDAGATPPFLQASLVAPYADGFAFVQALRERGGWPAIDAAWRSLPATTEQLLHADKRAANEPPIAVEAPRVGALAGDGWTAVYDDVMGEQGVRIMLEQWTSGALAREAAAGWGGDRFVIARRATAGGAAYATAWHLVLDARSDAIEVEAVLRGRFGDACRERADRGPFVWRSRGAHVVVVAGPFERVGAAPRSDGSCARSAAWADAILARALP